MQYDYMSYEAECEVRGDAVDTPFPHWPQTAAAST